MKFRVWQHTLHLITTSSSFPKKRISFHQIRKPSLLQHTKYVERKPRYFLKPSCKIQWATIDLSLKRLRRWIYIHPNLQRRTTNKGGETARSSYNLLIEKLEYNFKASEKKFVITIQNPYVQQYYHIWLLMTIPILMISSTGII